MSVATDTPAGSCRPQPAAAWEPAALRQIRESAQALRAEGKVEEAFEFFLSALEAVLRKTRDLELLVAKLRREGASGEAIGAHRSRAAATALRGAVQPEERGGPDGHDGSPGRGTGGRRLG